MTLLIPRVAPEFLSRRSLLWLLALSPVPALTSSAGGLFRRADPADEQINRVGQAYIELARREPDLPGVRSLTRLNKSFAGFSDADGSLLASALYLQARQRVRTAASPLRESAVLSKPVDISRFSRRSLERTLKQTKARMAQDAGYAGEVGAVPSSFRRLRLTCEDSEDNQISPWWCLLGCIIFVTLLIGLLILV
jgi:hypothetical protein